LRYTIKKVEDNRDVYFTIYWSHLTLADKYSIIKSVPSMSGIFELYYMDEKGKLNLFHVQKAWYGGLRHSIRMRTDPELEDNPEKRELLERYKCYYRFSILESYKDLTDILYFFAATYFPDRVTVDHSGRFDRIFVEEISADKIVTI